MTSSIACSSASVIDIGRINMPVVSFALVPRTPALNFWSEVS